MPDDGIVQLRRNTSKQLLPRPYGNRHGKTSKGPNSRSGKLTVPTGRKNLGGLSHSDSGTSLNQVSNHNGIESGDITPSHSPKSNGPTHRLPRGRSTASIGVSNGVSLGSHRYMGLSGGLGNLAQGHRKPVIQLEHDDDDDDDDDKDDPENTEYEDFEDDDDNTVEPLRPSLPDRSDSQLSIGIRPVEPTPPKLSEETVISVSSLADMASALKGARDKTGFVGNEDLISTAVNRSKNLGNMAQMVRGWNSTMQRTPVHSQTRKASALEAIKRNSIASIGDEDPREYEKVFREYTNSRAISNPVISSLYRISLKSLPSHRSKARNSDNLNTNAGDSTSNVPSRLQLPSVKKVNSLVATTANQMSDYSERSANRLFSEKYANIQSHGAIDSASAYTLNNIWQTGWVNSDDSATMKQTPGSKSRNIQGQAMRAQQQLSNGRDQHLGSTMRLAI